MRANNLAAQLVEEAKANGTLPKITDSILCVDCGKPAREYDHRDYLRPLDVHPVCSACNKQRGQGANRDVIVKHKYESHNDAGARFDPNPLITARKRRGLSVSELAKRVNRSPAAVSLTLRGKSAAPWLIFAMCSELNVPTTKVWVE